MSCVCSSTAFQGGGARAVQAEQIHRDVERGLHPQQQSGSSPTAVVGPSEILQILISPSSRSKWESDRKNQCRPRTVGMVPPKLGINLLCQHWNRGKPEAALTD
jgi:hypothetical protein